MSLESVHWEITDVTSLSDKELSDWRLTGYSIRDNTKAFTLMSLAMDSVAKSSRKLVLVEKDGPKVIGAKLLDFKGNLARVRDLPTKHTH